MSHFRIHAGARIVFGDRRTEERITPRVEIAYKAAGLTPPDYSHFDVADALRNIIAEAGKYRDYQSAVGLSGAKAKTWTQAAIKAELNANAARNLLGCIERATPWHINQRENEIIDATAAAVQPAVVAAIDLLRGAAPSLPREDPLNVDYALKHHLSRDHADALESLDTLGKLATLHDSEPYGIEGVGGLVALFDVPAFDPAPHVPYGTPGSQLGDDEPIRSNKHKQWIRFVESFRADPDTTLVDVARGDWSNIGIEFAWASTFKEAEERKQRLKNLWATKVDLAAVSSNRRNGKLAQR